MPMKKHVLGMKRNIAVQGPKCDFKSKLISFMISFYDVIA